MHECEQRAQRRAIPTSGVSRQTPKEPEGHPARTTRKGRDNLSTPLSLHLHTSRTPHAHPLPPFLPSPRGLYFVTRSLLFFPLAALHLRTLLAPSGHWRNILISQPRVACSASLSCLRHRTAVSIASTAFQGIENRTPESARFIASSFGYFCICLDDCVTLGGGVEPVSPSLVRHGDHY